VIASALYEDGHLVRHQADVGLGRGEDGQAGALPGCRHEQEARGHLDDGLPHLAAAEVPAGAARQGLESRGESSKVLGVRLAKAARRTERQPVL
jgi:hypothetical protein